MFSQAGKSLRKGWCYAKEGLHYVSGVCVCSFTQSRGWTRQFSCEYLMASTTGVLLWTCKLIVSCLVLSAYRWVSWVSWPPRRGCFLGCLCYSRPQYQPLFCWDCEQPGHIPKPNKAAETHHRKRCSHWVLLLTEDAAAAASFVQDKGMEVNVWFPEPDSLTVTFPCAAGSDSSSILEPAMQLLKSSYAPLSKGMLQLPTSAV